MKAARSESQAARGESQPARGESPVLAPLACCGETEKVRQFLNKTRMPKDELVLHPAEENGPRTCLNEQYTAYLQLKLCLKTKVQAVVQNVVW